MTTSITINHADRAHSSLVGGSTAKRRINCPASYQDEQRVPPAPTSQFAEEGTACHEAMTLILEENLTADDIVGKQFNGFPMRPQRVNETVRPALAFFDKLCDELEAEGGFRFIVEQSVAFPGIPGAFGTGDVIGRTDKRSIVLDWKFGGGVAVDAEENEQGMYYAEAARSDHPELFEHDDDWPVEIIIAQPRLDAYGRWMTNVGRLKKFRAELIEAIESAQSDNPRRAKEIGPWCDFAACKVVCPLWVKPVAKVLEIADPSKPLPTVQTMTPTELSDFYSRLLELKEFVEPLFAEATKQAHQFLEEGGTIPGWMLAQKRATRSWTDEDLAARELKKLGLNTMDMFISSFVSPAQAEKVLKAYGKKLPDEVAGKIIQKVSSGTTIARSDGGHTPAITTSQQAQQLAAKLGVLKKGKK